MKIKYIAGTKKLKPIIEKFINDFNYTEWNKGWLINYVYKGVSLIGKTSTAKKLFKKYGYTMEIKIGGTFELYKD